MNIRLIALAGLTVCFLFGILRSEASDATAELTARLQALEHLQGRFEQRQYDDSGQLVQVSGGLYAGYIQSGLEIPEYNGTEGEFHADSEYKWYHYYTFQKQSDFLMGLRFRFTLPRVSEKLAMLLLMEYAGSD